MADPKFLKFDTLSLHAGQQPDPVTGARAVKNWIEVASVVQLRGEAPFSVTFFVSDRAGRELFFNIEIEGVSLLLSEREEIGAMLDRNRGDIDALIAQLRQLG